MAIIESSINQTSGDYATISAWAASVPALGTDIYKGIITDAAEYDEAVNLNPGGSPSATSYLWLTVDAGVRHAGAWDTSKARLAYTGSDTAAITVRANYTFVEGLQIYRPTSGSIGSSDECIRVESTAPTDVLLSRLVLWTDDNGSSGDTDGIYTGNWPINKLSLDHVVIYGFQRGGIHLQQFNGANGQVVNIDHCALSWSGDGNDLEAPLIIRASAIGATTAVTSHNSIYGPGRTGSTVAVVGRGDVAGGTPSFAGSHNALAGGIAAQITDTTTDQATATTIGTADTAGTIIVADATSNPVTAATDLTIVNLANNVAIGAGTNRQGSEPDFRQDFATDIAGTARPTTGVDIGPWQVSLAGGTTATATTATATGAAADPTPQAWTDIGFVSDDFNGTGLGTHWQFIDPRGDCSWTILGPGLGDAKLQTTIPSGGSSHNSYGPNRNSPWFAQVPTDFGADFELRARFTTMPTTAIQSFGFLVTQDLDDWAIFQIYHDGTDTRAIAATTTNDSGTTEADIVIAPAGLSIFVRVNRVGTMWSFDWADARFGPWNNVATFTYSINNAALGPFFGTHTPEPGFVGTLDWVESAADPLPVFVENDTATYIGPPVTTATATGTAYDATVATGSGPTTATPAVAAGTGTGYDAVVATTSNVTATPTVAAGTGTGHDATATTSSTVTATAGHATARGVASAANLHYDTTGMLSFWSFDEGAGTTANDLIGGHHLEIEAGSISTWETGGLHATGVTRLESTTTGADIVEAVQASQQFTIDAWITPDQASDTGPAVVLAMNTNASGPGNFTFGQGDDAGGTPGDVWSIRARRVGSGNNLGNPGSNTTVGSLAVDTLQHVAFTVAVAGSTMTITRYIDGALDGTNTRTVTAGQAYDTWAPHTLTAFNESNNARPWLGTIRQLALYATALDLAAIQANYAAGPGRVLAPAVAATCTGSAHDATVETSTTGNAAPATAPATGSAEGMSETVASLTLIAQSPIAATGTAHDATVATAPVATPTTATATGAAPFVPGTVVGLTMVSEQAIQATGEAYNAFVPTTGFGIADTPDTAIVAYDATAVTSSNGTADPSTATATATTGATASLTIPAPTATATGAAYMGIAATSSNGTTPALATGTAYDATITTDAQAVATPTAAAGTSTGHDASVATTSNVTVTATTATATGTASGATVAVSISGTATPTAALATGTGHDATITASSTITATPTAAAGTGTGHDAAVTTIPQRVAPATSATATGSAPSASIELGPAGMATDAGTGQAYNAVIQSFALGVAQPPTAPGTGQADEPLVVIVCRAVTATGTGGAGNAQSARTGSAVAGIPGRLLSQSVVVVDPVETVDAYGNVELDYGPGAHRSSIACWLQQDQRSEDHGEGRSATDQRWLLITNVTTLEADQRLEWIDPNGALVVFHVEGIPEFAFRAPGGALHHIEATLKRETG